MYNVNIIFSCCFYPDAALSDVKFSALNIADVKPNYPGVLFSKTCSRKEVDQEGAVIIGEGIIVSIPRKAIIPGDMVPLTVQACLKGPFKLCRDYVPISPVYLLHPPCVFHRDVQLKIKTFAIIEDRDEIAFFTSPDAPDIRNDESRWKFREESVEVHVVPRNKEVVVDVRHFCFGLLARRKRRSMF